MGANGHPPLILLGDEEYDFLGGKGGSTLGKEKKRRTRSRKVIKPNT